MIIAEIAQAHDGSVGILHSYIDALATTGVDVIKFQTHIAEAESSEHEPFRKPFSYVDKTRFDYWKRMELTIEQWKQVKDHCDNAGIEFLSSPFSCAAVDLLENLNVKKYKVGSGEIINHLLLDKIARTGKPVILSSGMSSYNELDSAVDLVREKVPLSVMQCTTSYPANPLQWGLDIISVLKNRYNIPVGFSDHSGDIFASLAATALGADLVEFHVVFDKKMFGPDATASVEVRDVDRLVSGIKQIRQSINSNHQKDLFAGECETLKKMFGKSLAINKPVSTGHVVTLNDLEAKKPAGFGIPAKDYQQIIGKRIKENMAKWDFITADHIQ